MAILDPGILPRVFYRRLGWICTDYADYLIKVESVSQNTKAAYRNLLVTGPGYLICAIS